MRYQKWLNRSVVVHNGPIKGLLKSNGYNDVIVVYVSPTNREIHSIDVGNFKTIPCKIVI